MWTFWIYQDNKGKWRWRLLARNKKIVADGAEGYSSKANVVRAVKRFMAMMGKAEKFAVSVPE
jgi:uncharacterized protein YegP (UPF0339 family)